MARARFSLRACLLAGGLASTPCCQVSAGEVLDRIRAHHEIVIAHRESSIPFSYFADGQPVGYAIDLCRQVVSAVQRNLGMARVDIKFLRVGPSDRIRAIVEARADLECGSTTNNAERRSAVEFTVPHFIAGTRIAVRADSQLQTLPDFRSRRLVSVTGTTSLPVLRRLNSERSLDLTVVEAPTTAAALGLVESGAADGFVMDDVLLHGAIAALGMAQRIKIIGPYLTIEPLSVVMSKADPEFKAIVDSEMKRIIRDGEIRRIYDKWFMEPIAPAATPLNVRPSSLLLAIWRFPDDYVPR